MGLDENHQVYEDGCYLRVSTEEDCWTVAEVCALLTASWSVDLNLSSHVMF